MECKWLNRVKTTVKGGIKVEPYWNVNNGYYANRNKKVNIKVEPYWNVNFEVASTVVKLLSD